MRAKTYQIALKFCEGRQHIKEHFPHRVSRASFGTTRLGLVMRNQGKEVVSDVLEFVVMPA